MEFLEFLLLDFFIGLSEKNALRDTWNLTKTENKTLSATENGSNGSPPVSVEVIAATIVDSSANSPESTQCIVAEVVRPVPGETSPEAIAHMFAQLHGKGDRGDKNRDTDVDSASIDDGVDNGICRGTDNGIGNGIG